MTVAVQRSNPVKNRSSRREPARPILSVEFGRPVLIWFEELALNFAQIDDFLFASMFSLLGILVDLIRS
jgi:hypothetical protein